MQGSRTSLQTVKTGMVRHIDDHRPACLCECTNAGLDLPPLRIFDLPWIAGKYRHTIPDRQLAQQRLAIDVAKRRIDVTESGTILIFDAEQHIQSATLQVRIHQHALDATLRQRAGKHGRQRADSHTGDCGAQHHHAVHIGMLRHRMRRMQARHGTVHGHRRTRIGFRPRRNGVIVSVADHSGWSVETLRRYGLPRSRRLRRQRHLGGNGWYSVHTAD